MISILYSINPVRLPAFIKYLTINQNKVIACVTLIFV